MHLVMCLALMLNRDPHRPALPAQLFGEPLGDQCLALARHFVAQA
jgi:hypothetical protein